MITVDSRKEDIEGEMEVSQFVTEGTLACSEGNCLITYEESEVTGMDGTTTMLKVESGSVMLIRSGTLSSLLVFEKGKTHWSGYETQFGSIQIGITANRVDVEMTETGGNISVDYMMDFNGARGGRNSIHVDVRLK